MPAPMDGLPRLIVTLLCGRLRLLDTWRLLAVAFDSKHNQLVARQATGDGWIMAAFWLSSDRSAIDPTIPWLCSRVGVAVVVLMPVVGLARRAMGRAASTRSA